MMSHSIYCEILYCLKKNFINTGALSFSVARQAPQQNDCLYVSPQEVQKGKCLLLVSKMVDLIYLFYLENDSFKLALHYSDGVLH